MLPNFTPSAALWEELKILKQLSGVIKNNYLKVKKIHDQDNQEA